MASISRQAIKLEPVDLNSLIQSLIHERPDLQSPRSEVHIESALDPVLGREASLTQCLTNLLSNAVKFVAPGVRPRIRIRTELIPAAAANGISGSEVPTENPANGGEVPPAPRHFVRLWIEDNGIGIDKTTQSKLFQMFARVHSGAYYEGAGLGLAIVRKAVERMGGTAGLVSELGGGSRFWLQLLSAKAEEDRPPSKT